MTRTICIYHANCADGFTAAWAVREALGETVEYIPAGYGDEPPDVAGADVIIVDFSYKRPVLERMAHTARSIIVLDHHKTARDDLINLPRPAGDGMHIERLPETPPRSSIWIGAVRKWHGTTSIRARAPSWSMSWLIAICGAGG